MGGGREPSLDARIVDANGQELSEIVYTIGESVDPEFYVKSDNYGERLQFLELDCGKTEEVAFTRGEYNKLKKRFKITVQYVPNKPGSYTYTLFVNYDDKIDDCQELQFTVKVQGQEIETDENIVITLTKNVESTGYVEDELSVEAKTNIECTFTYQWFSTDDNSGADTKIDGAVSQVFTPTAAGRYFCRITAVSTKNSSLKKSQDSAACTVSVRSPNDPVKPVITKQPVATSVEVGGSFTLSVTAAVSDGGTLSYQWYNDKGMLQGATSVTYTKNSAAVADSGEYYVIVTNTRNGKTITATSNKVKVTVNAPVGETGSVGGSFDFN